MLAPVLILSIGAVVVHLDVADNIEEARSTKLIAELVKAISERTGQRAIADDRTGECGEGSVEELRLRNRGKEVVCVQAIAAVTTIGVFVFVPGTQKEQVREGLDRDPAGWPAAMKQIAARLFPAKAPVQEISKPAQKPAPLQRVVGRDPTPPLEVEPELSTGPIWLLASAGALGLVAGGVFLSSDASLNRVQGKLDVRDENLRIIGIDYDDAIDEYRSINTRRNVAFITALVAAGVAATGVTWWILDSPQPVRTSDPRRMVSFSW